MKKLNLKWVSDVIGDDYRKWKYGDIVCIQAQTGTGKTYFITGNKETRGLIDTIEDYEYLIYICNRTELKRQIKLDLLEKFGDLNDVIKDNKIDYDKLDKKTVIHNIVITSYHAIAYGKLDNIFGGKYSDMDIYKYIIMDECHFFLTDAGFNNKTVLAYEKLIKEYAARSIKILISATMDEMKPLILKEHDEQIKNPHGLYSESKLYDKYTTEIDYSYLNIKYFKELKDICTIVKNDKSKDKWIIFIKSKNDGETIENYFKDNNIDCEFVQATIENDEKENITTHNKFNSKVLVSTNCLDNGINIKDNSVKNIIVMAYNKITFIQELGRIRFNIKDAPVINLYIPMFSKAEFNGLYQTNKSLIDKINLYNKDYNEFCKTYNYDLSKIKDTIFYLDNGKYCINKMGAYRTYKNKSFSSKIYNAIKDDEFAYIKEQLSWLNLQDTFNKNNLIEDVVDENEVQDLENYLKDIFDNKKVFLTAKDRKPLIENIGLIDKHNSKLSENKIAYIKSIETLNSHLKSIESSYRLKQFETSRVIEGKKTKYKNAIKLQKIVG